MSLKTNWWCKSRRAQTNEDYETWLEGGVVPTLNAFDNGDTRATVIIFYGNRVDDIRVQGDVVNTLQARMGTGGGNMPLVAFDTKFGSNANTFEDQSPTLKASQGAPSIVMPTLSAQNNPSRSPQSAEVTAQINAMVQATSIVRRLTPKECERLQGFPDEWTRLDKDGKEITDGHRYEQMGNAVAIPVVEWIVGRLVDSDDLAERPPC